MHEPYQKRIPGADCAILFVHGILGSPNHFTPLMQLVPEGVTVVNLLLDGHGKSVRDFSRSRMRIWQKQVTDAVEELAASHQKVFVVAHSMGTLLALNAAAETGNVTELFLLALPIRLSLRFRLLSNMMKVFFGRISPEDEAAVASRDACSITLSKNVFLYIGWIPRYLELFRKIDRTRRLLPGLSVPATVFQSAMDEMVSPASVPYLKDKTNFTLHLLENSEHYRYSPEDLDRILGSFSEMLERHTH